MYRAVKGTKYFLFLEYLKLNVNCLCVRKENTKQKEIIHLVDPRTLQNKAAKTIFWILESKNVSIASIGNSVFHEIDNVKCQPYKHWGVFSIPNSFFACNFFVLEPISPKFGNFS